jgi:hypothetical protein
MPTFKFATRSAVSSSVNWLIWSTIPEIFGFIGAAAAEASVLVHRLDECVLDSFRLKLIQAADEERRIHCDGEAFLDDLRRKDLQQRAVVEDGTEKDIFVWRLALGN